MKEELVLRLDFCEECFQMTNHIGDECQKCKAKEMKKSRYDSDSDEDENDYKIRKSWNTIIKYRLMISLTLTRH